MSQPIEWTGNLDAEFSGAELKDKRLTRRLMTLAERVSEAPSKGFPQVMASNAELEATYRFLTNERVEWGEILEPHLAASAERCRALKVVVAAHDTSEFAFGGKSRVDAVGHLPHGRPGFFGHFALGVAPDEEHMALGILTAQTVRRDGAAKEETVAERRARNRATPVDEKESWRWVASADEAQNRIGPDVTVIHVMDREADDFALLDALHVGGHRFVIRACSDRRLPKNTEGPRTVSEALSQTEDVLFRDVHLGARKKKPGQVHKHPARESRMASLHIRACTVTVPRPRVDCGGDTTLALNVVEVFEPSPPPGEEPISWTLLTTEPIDTAEQRAQVVDYYRARWPIEEFFKSLKTGCAFEQRQLESEHALLNALALFIPIAWRLHLLRHLARNHPEAPATHVFTPDEVYVLAQLSKRVKLSPTATLGDAMLAIAGLGGHLKRNGPPGWLTLGRGYQDFVMACAGYALARRTM
jgi:hypothetical protein